MNIHPVSQRVNKSLEIDLKLVDLLNLTEQCIKGTDAGKQMSYGATDI